MKENKEKSNRTQHIKIIAYWVFTGIVALETAAGAQWDLTRNDFVKQTFAHLGYPLSCLPSLGYGKYRL